MKSLSTSYEANPILQKGKEKRKKREPFKDGELVVCSFSFSVPFQK